MEAWMPQPSPPTRISSIRTKSLIGESSSSYQLTQEHMVKCLVDIVTQGTQFNKSAGMSLSSQMTGNIYIGSEFLEGFPTIRGQCQTIEIRFKHSAQMIKDQVDPLSHCNTPRTVKQRPDGCSFLLNERVQDTLA